MKKLKDNDIRMQLLRYLKKEFEHNSNTKIVNEMGVLHGQSRVDVAVINDLLHGYEIKSESDNLLRLPSQLSDYNKVFDRMTIVVQKKHLDEVRNIVPSWWGIILVTNKSGCPSLKKIRRGKLNNKIDSSAITQLLWREEALNILKKNDLQKGLLSKPKRYIYTKLSASFSINELREKIIKQLHSREHWLEN